MKPRRRPSIVSTISVLALSMLLGASAEAQRGDGAGPAGIGDGPWDYETQEGSLHVSVLTKDLQSPWSLVFTPDGDMLVAERSGRLRVIRDGVLDPEPISGLPYIAAPGITGLMGMALHPDFEDNRLIYFAYPKSRPWDRDMLSLAVARAVWDGGDSLNDVEDVWVGNQWHSSAISAENDLCCGQGPAAGSFGARITFDDEGMLYIASGERNWGEMAQNPQSHFGKIVRIHDDGAIPEDNPFTGNDEYLQDIYTLGHRNPTGLRYIPETGELWSTEFGPAGGDELNLIRAGENYGWMLISEGEHYDGTERELGTGGIEGYTDPVRWWPRYGNPGNVIVYTGDLFPQWQNDVFVAAMSRPGALVRVTTDADRNFVSEERLLEDLGQRMRDVVQGPDGKIYVLTETQAFNSPGSIIVLEPGD